MAGEEVVGGIVGFLRLDADEFHREITKAIAEVKLLKGMDAKVKVEATGTKRTEAELLGVAKAAKGVERNVGGMNEGFRGLRSPQLIVGGIAAGMALLGPVTGAATAAMGGFVGVVVAFQLVFLIISRDPVRLRPIMPACVVKKLSFGIAAWALYFAQRVRSDILVFATIDLVLAALFVVAWSRTANATIT